MRGAKETRPCAACGKPLTKLLSQARGQNWYCNNQCQASHMPPPGTISKQANPYRGQQETRPCVICQSPVTRYLTPRTVAQDWACSYECAGKNQAVVRMADGTWTKPRKPRTGDTIPCSVCGTEFYRQPAYITQGRHLCSRACNKAWQGRNQITKTCPQCGGPFTVRPRETSTKHCSRACEVKAKTKRDVGRMHNGRPVIRDSHGYLTVYEPNHPAANQHNGRVLEHRLIVEKRIGRYLDPKEHVNHIDHDPSNNADENLEILNPRDHGIETSAYTNAARQKLADRLAEYERRFGPLS